MARGLFNTNTPYPDIRQPAIQPAGLPGSTFVQVQRKEVGGNFRALAESLGNLSGALSSFARSSEVRQDDPNSPENRKFLDTVAQMDQGDLSKVDPSSLNRVQQDALATALGGKGAQVFRGQIFDDYHQNFDKDTGDFNSWYEDRRKQFAQQLPSDAARAQFYRQTENFKEQMWNKDTEQKVGTALENRDDAVYATITNDVDDAIANGHKPLDIANAVIAHSTANRKFMALGGKAQNEILFRIAQKYAAEGQVDIVKGILNHSRDGVGPLSKTAEYQTKSYSLIETAERVHDSNASQVSFDDRLQIEKDIREGTYTEEKARRYREKYPDTYKVPQAANDVDMSERGRLAAEEAYNKEQAKRQRRAQSLQEEAQAEANVYGGLLKFGGAHDVEDVTITGPEGTPKTISRDELLDRAVKRFLRTTDEAEKEMIARGASPDEARRQITARKLEWFDHNDIDNPEWKREFNSIARAGSLKRVLRKGEISSHLSQVAENYWLLYRENPAYARKLVTDDDARDFLDEYVASRGGGTTTGEGTFQVSAQEALVSAAERVAMTPDQKAAAFVKEEDIAKASKDMMNQADAEENTAINRGYIAGKLRRYVRKGLSVDDARTRVQADLQYRTTTINGAWVLTPHRAPKDFQVLVEKHLQKVAEIPAVKKSGVQDWTDLTIVPVNPGDETNKDFIIVSKSRGWTPVLEGSRLGPTELDAARQTIKREAREQLRQEQESSKTWQRTLKNLTPPAPAQVNPQDVSARRVSSSTPPLPPTSPRNRDRPDVLPKRDDSSPLKRNRDRLDVLPKQDDSSLLERTKKKFYENR